jgi:hypothetical protein
MNRLPLALTVKVRVDPASILKNPKVHDLAHHFLEEMMRARLMVGSTPAGMPSRLCFSVC